MAQEIAISDNTIFEKLRERGLSPEMLIDMIDNIRQCKNCGIKFIARKGLLMYCSKSCKSAFNMRNNLNAHRKRHPDKICAYDQCKKTFHSSHERVRYCSLKCAREAKKIPPRIKQCVMCKKDFTTNKPYQKFCTIGCRGAAMRKIKVKVNCAICEKEILKHPESVKRSKNQKFYCSWSCHNVGLFYWRLSEEARKKYAVIIRSNPLTKYKRLRLAALLMIDPNLKCVNCSCDMLEVIEINHKNGGGAKEYKFMNQEGVSQIKFFYNILNGVRATSDLELTCRVCNALHYVEQKKGVRGHKVIWMPERKA